MNKVDKIRKINNKIVSKNKIDSFERQLINLMNGLYDMNYPMIISNNTKCLNYIDEIDENKILIINPYKVIKINNEHEIGSSFIMNIYDMLSTSLFAMDSITQPTSKVIVLDELDERDGSPIIAICRYDAKRGGFDLNQITSIYGKEKFNSLIINTLNANKKFELNTNYPKNELKEKIEQLLRDEEIEVPINLETVIVGIEKNEENIWGLLLGTGYLKVTEVVDLAHGIYKVKIPNYEIKFLFQNIIREWFNDKVIGNNLNTILKDLVTLNLEEFEEKFKQLVIEMFSFMDVGKNTAENFYHAFVLGMLVGLKDNYYVKSNRESGFGRYDIMLEPKDKNGNSFVMEFKVLEDEEEKTIEDTIENAKKQIEERKYAEDLEERGYTKITKMVFAFKGKEVKMKVI
mgnify:CR=1 FL=1